MSLGNIIDCICKEATNRDSKKLEQLLEQLYDYESPKILDIFPYQIKSNEKYSQVEIFFDKLEMIDFQQKTQNYHAYQKSLEKFERFFELIWLRSSEFYAFYYLPEPLYKDQLYYKIYENEWNQIIPKDLTEGILLNIDEYSMLISLIKLAVSDHLYIHFIILEENIVFSGNGLAFLIYSQHNLDLLEKIANTEGLYIR
ncbi:hypothetical protein ACVNNN_12660 [Lysinibacillus fusiformis]|uniref:hypothetical protein n=1 Tax=Lysinibacillus sp. PWR01 TaxID=3342384 RepID=UPI00372D78D5